MLFQTEDGRPQWRRWVGLLALAALALPGPAGAPADAAKTRGESTGEEAAEPSPLPLGDPWEATVVEPEPPAPGPAAPWEAADSEPDGMPLPAAPARAPAVKAGGAAPGERTRGKPTATASSPDLVPPEREYLRTTLVRYAQENGLPADLVMALAWKESSWRVRVVSDAGAIGVMQLMPDTIDFTSHTLMGLRRNLDPRDAVSNIRMGTRFLRHLVDRSGASYRKALIAYNQGITSLKAHGSYGESEAFAESVLALRSRFRRP